MSKCVLLFVTILWLCGCVTRPKVADSDPIYEKPTCDLLTKALYHLAEIRNCTWDDDGILLWRKVGSTTDTYNMADMPAWQGQFISALAYKWAVDRRQPSTPKETDVFCERELLRALRGLECCYEATGIPGCLCRSVIRHNSDEPLSWMKTYEIAREHGSLEKGWWQKGYNGFWFRTQPAGGHYMGVWVALCVIGGLHQQGAICLSPEGFDRIQNFVTPLYNRVRDAGGHVTGIDGEVTGYGNMSVYGVNPQMALWQLVRCRAAALWGVPGAQEEYDEKIDWYASVVKNSYRTMVPMMVRVPLSSRLKLKPNDIHWQHHGWLGLLAANGAESDEHMRDIRRGFEELWRLHDPFNMHNYIVQRIGRPKLNDTEAHRWFLNAMEWYPINKFNFEKQGSVDTDEWQPIQNRKINTNYAKGKPWQKATQSDFNGGTRSEVLECGFDYILYYYMATYYGVF